MNEPPAMSPPPVSTSVDGQEGGDDGPPIDTHGESLGVPPPGASEDDPLDLDDQMMLARVQASVLGTSVPVRVGRFRPLERIGEGSFSKVFEAYDPKLDRNVALKMFKHDTVLDEEHRKRVLTEGRALARLDHPNVATIYEVDDHQGQLFLAMQLVQGETLQKVQRGLAWTKIVELYLAAGRGLVAAHEADLVHGDFKPTNVVVKGEDQQPRVLDFGLASRQDLGGDPAHVTEDLQPGDALDVDQVLPGTTGATVRGTPAYMAPELFERRPATERSDQFSFCVALFEALYGRRPFPGNTLAQLRRSLESGELQAPTVPERAGSPKRLFECLRRGLSIEPEKRYPSVRELLADLGKALPRRGARWFPWAAAAAVAVATFGVGAIEDTLENRRCTADADELRATWTETEASLSEIGRELAPVVGQELEDLASSWEGACLVERSDPCRGRSKAEASRFLEEIGRSGLPPHGHAELVSSFDLCLEDLEPLPTCGNADVDPEAFVHLHDARVLLQFGKAEQAIEAAQRGYELAGEAKLAKAEALTVLGEAKAQKGLLGDARAAFEDAIALAMVCDDDVLAVDAALGQVQAEIRVSGGREGRVGFAIELANAMLEKPQMAKLTKRQAMLRDKRAGVARLLSGKCDDSIERSFEEAKRLREKLVERRRRQGQPVRHARMEVANTALNLASYRLDCTDAEVSVINDDLEAARQEFLEAVGVEDHPALATYDFQLGRSLAIAGRFEEAEAAYQRALTTSRRFGGEDGASAADVHFAMAAMLRDRDPRRALAEAKAALDIREGQPEPDRLALAESYDALGSIAQVLPEPDYEEALRWHRKGAELLRGAPASDPLDSHERDLLALLLAHEAVDLCLLERKDEAATAIESARSVDGERGPEIVALLEPIESGLAGAGCGGG